MGILAAIISMLSLGISTFLYKKCSVLGVTNTTFFYYAFGFAIATGVWLFAAEKITYQRSDLFWPFLTAASLFISVWTFNFAVQFIPMSMAAPVRGMSFIITVFLAVFISGEKLVPKDWLALSLAVGAVFVFASAESDRSLGKKTGETAQVVEREG